MKKIKSLMLVGLAAVILSSCSTVMPYTATNNPIGSKRGTSSTVLLGMAGMGNLGAGYVFNKDYGVIDAIKDGGISTVATVDIKVTNYFLWQKAEVIVTGN